MARAHGAGLMLLPVRDRNAPERHHACSACVARPRRPARWPCTRGDGRGGRHVAVVVYEVVGVGILRRGLAQRRPALGLGALLVGAGVTLLVPEPGPCCRSRPHRRSSVGRSNCHQGGKQPCRSCSAPHSSPACWPARAADARARGRQARAAVPDEPRHEVRPDAAHRASRRAAEARLHDAPSDCADIDVLEHARRLQRRARVSIPFSGPIDLITVTPDTVFLVDPKGQRTPLDRLVWTPATNTLHGLPHTYLSQHTPYVLVVTDGVKAADGSALDPSGFRASIELGRSHDVGEKLYRLALLGALHWAHVPLGHIVDASLFTTQSITSLLEKVRRQIDRSSPAPATFAIGPGGERTVFPFSSVAGVQFHRQTGTSTFSDSPLPRRGRRLPGAIGTVAYGSFSSPDYENAVEVIPPVGTRDRRAEAAGHEHALLQPVAAVGRPSRPAAGRWRSSATASPTRSTARPWTVASTLATQGHRHDRDQRRRPRRRPARARSPCSATDGAPVDVPAGGRGIDQDGNGTIDSTEGVSAAPPFAVDRQPRRPAPDGDRPDAARARDPGRRRRGRRRQARPRRVAASTTPASRSAASTARSSSASSRPSTPACPTSPAARSPRSRGSAPSFRPLVGIALATRAADRSTTPCRTRRSRTSTRTCRCATCRRSSTRCRAPTRSRTCSTSTSWAQQAGNPVAWAPFIRAQPLRGNGAEAGDRPVRQGRRDGAEPDGVGDHPRRRARGPRHVLPQRPRLRERAGLHGQEPAHVPHATSAARRAPLAVAAQQQIATFFASGGAVTIDPDGAGPLFETPIAGPLPETLNFLP